MLRRLVSRAHLLALPVLAALAACQDAGDPLVAPRPQFAQGDNDLWTVNSLADPGAGGCDDVECTLREAIDAASSGGTIVFAGGLQGAIGLTAGDLVVRKDLTIDGDGRIAIDAQGNSRVMEVNALAVANPITVTLAGLTLKNGREVGGGGLVIFFDATVTVRNSTIADNTSTAAAGGIAIESSSSLTLVNSTVSGNTAATDGGGLFITGGQVSVLGSTFSGNSATRGGAISNGNGAGLPSPAGGILTIRSSTITANSATVLGGGVVHGGSGGNRTTLANSIVAGNTAAASATSNDCSAPSGGSSSLGHNLGGCPFLFTAGGDAIVQPAQVFTEVLEQDLDDNGGPTQTHALIARGRAVDAGYCPGETADQRGFARPVDVALMPNAVDACDIGAYELQGPVAVVADLLVSQSVNKTSVKQGELLTYTVRVRNLGPQTAPNVVLTDVLPSGVTFVEARHNKGTHTAPPQGETGAVTWTVGDMLDQANETATITVTVLVKGRTTITNTASVTGDVSDPNAANNSAAITVSVAAGGSAPPKKK